jgi:hypothetical protein
MERAIVVNVPGLRWDAGAPEPVLVASEDRTLIAFCADDGDVVDGTEIQTAEFVGCTAVKFGFPNDEVLNGHPLWGHGLEPYALHEVQDSIWLEQIRAIERVHPESRPTPFANAKHFILTFHDTTMEAIATGVTSLATYATVVEATAALSKLVHERHLGA